MLPRDIGGIAPLQTLQDGTLLFSALIAVLYPSKIIVTLLHIPIFVQLYLFRTLNIALEYTLATRFLLIFPCLNHHRHLCRDLEYIWGTPKKEEKTVLLCGNRT